MRRNPTGFAIVVGPTSFTSLRQQNPELWR
jgi:hypothetical protein